MTISRRLKIAAVSISILALAACDSAEERAEAHYESSVALIESGDVERGLVELRNVLTLNEFHVAGRKLYARTLRQSGNIVESYQQYRRLVETTPDDHESRLALAEMAISAQNWDEAERHGAVLIQANAQLEGTEIVDLTLRFRSAVLDEDNAAVRELTREALALVDTHPNDVTLRQIIIEGLVRDGDYAAAVEQLDVAIELAPDERRLYMAKARALAQLQDAEGLEDFLRETVTRFPDDTNSKLALIRLYSSQGKSGEAADFLRELAETTGKDSDVVTLIAFLRQSDGNDAALAEIESRLATAETPDFLNALKSAIYFETDRRDEAISLMQSIVEGAEPSEQNDRFKVSLAKMLLAEGNEVGARQIVEEVLSRDNAQTDALKMSAKWAIEDDRPEAAIQQLRIALDQEPDDAEAMTLMSEAHTRMGDVELAQDLLSLAVEASGNAPEESIRFAQLLMSEERFRPAEDVLISALKNDPGNLRILIMLGDIYVETEDWGRAAQVEATLRRQEATAATRAADRLRLQTLTRREGRDQAVAFLESLAQDGDAADAAKLGLIRARLAEGDAAAAITLAEELKTERPDNARVGLIVGNTYLAAREYDQAESTFRAIVDKDPRAEQAWIQLSRTLSAQGRLDEARATVDEALAAAPDAPNILWAKASFLERANDIDGAIEIYEALYERNSDSLVVANNLASLLATYREDQESIDRAFAVGRRLRGTDFPPFQDTYGWLLYRTGDYDEALQYLVPAARSLSGDPIVQYHLAMTYLALERNDEALSAFERSVEIAGENDPRPQIERAKSEIARISSGVATE